MSSILVSGLFNMETTVKIRGFPISYYPIDYDFFGVASSLSGVGFNLTKARANAWTFLLTLGISNIDNGLSWQVDKNYAKIGMY